MFRFHILEMKCSWRDVKWEWKEHERTMKGNERKWKENERNMKGQWKEMRGNERIMKGTWKQLNPKVWVLIPFDVVRYVVRTSFGRRSKQLTVSLQNPTGKIYMWWITGVPIWHQCFLLYLIPLWRCFGSCVHKVFPHLSHSKTCQNRVCRTSASHWGWPCFWSTYLTSWSNGVPMRFDTILLNWSTLTVRSILSDILSDILSYLYINRHPYIHVNILYASLIFDKKMCV